MAVPDRDLSERLCACVARRQGAHPPTLSELQAFLEGERGLERRKLPEHLLTLDRLPLGPTGKVCRSTLARLAAARIGDPARTSSRTREAPR
ncbi:hypothetical protein BIV24_29265 [Streptomyces colonosanans]|uniref:AMP-binding enzyme C-terminal domain-containing protein n=1 Tax=Streptomyces colonosanans TaxID=1428652 RepID=A0A1S2NUJ6_9ACTN|nr:hypothetical protein BIV24_29265 [Streptomyces colonosanans]